MLRIRKRLCLLAFLILVCAAAFDGQTDRVHLAPDRASNPTPDLAPPLASSRLRADWPARPEPPAPPSPPISVVPVTLPQMVRAAGVIFAGTVTAITRPPASAKDAVATVAITFHVNRGLRGAVSGQDFTIRQWIGLWTSGQQRYRMGEQVLLFLYPTSKLGLTSCVAGSLGRFPIDDLGRVLLSPQHLSAFRADLVLGGKPSVSFWDFSWAVQRAAGKK